MIVPGNGSSLCCSGPAGYVEFTCTGYPRSPSSLGSPSCSTNVLAPSPSGSPGQSQLPRPRPSPVSASTRV